MSVFLDIIGSLILIGILMTAIFGITVNLNQTAHEKSFQLNMQTNCLSLAKVIVSDFVKIGYHVPDSIASIISADSTSIVFAADLQNNNILDTVGYYISSTTAPVVASTKNPRDRVIYRTMNGQSSINMNLGLTDFKLTYFDTLGAKTTIPSQIRSVNIKMRFESPERVMMPTDSPADTLYPGVFWEKRIYPRNL